MIKGYLIQYKSFVNGCLFLIHQQSPQSHPEPPAQPKDNKVVASPPVSVKPSLPQPISIKPALPKKPEVQARPLGMYRPLPFNWFPPLIFSMVDSSPLRLSEPQ